MAWWEDGGICFCGSKCVSGWVILQIWISINLPPQESPELCNETRFFIMQARRVVFKSCQSAVCPLGSEAGGRAATPVDVLIQPAHVSQWFPVIPTAADHRDSPMVAPVPTTAILHSTAEHDGGETCTKESQSPPNTPLWEMFPWIQSQRNMVKTLKRWLTEHLL